MRRKRRQLMSLIDIDEYSSWKEKDSYKPTRRR
jgi:hypothetical protein